MPTGWFFAKSERWHDPERPSLVAYRHAIWLRHAEQIRADGGTYIDQECLGSQYVVKVLASISTLTAITNDVGCDRIPKNVLNDSLDTLTNPQKNALKNKLQELGYPVAEINERFPGDLGQYTVRDVLRFALRRRRQPRYDQPTDTIVWDGAEEIPVDIDEIDTGIGDS